ncbi:MAG: hypothetical protein COA43_14830 [Robiginitomaculum sp.]|nr:MAG: hypothetical protein COA43_14830 [Robiginitomaculum sp.]
MFKMSDEQKKLFDVLTSLQREISLNSISGMNDIDAYKASKGKAKKANTMQASVSEILINPNVKLFIDSMNEEAVSNAVMSRQEMMEELTLIARTNSNDLIEWGYRDVRVVNDDGEEEVQKQSFWTLRSNEDINPEHMNAIEEVSVGKEGLKFKRTSKLSAMKQLAVLAGYESPTEIITSNVNYDISTQDPKKAAQEYMALIKNTDE